MTEHDKGLGRAKKLCLALSKICLLKVSLVGSFKHFPDSCGMQITAYFVHAVSKKVFIFGLVHHLR